MLSALTEGAVKGFCASVLSFASEVLELFSWMRSDTSAVGAAPVALSVLTSFAPDFLTWPSACVAETAAGAANVDAASVGVTSGKSGSAEPGVAHVELLLPASTAVPSAEAAVEASAAGVSLWGFPTSEASPALASGLAAVTADLLPPLEDEDSAIAAKVCCSSFPAVPREDILSPLSSCPLHWLSCEWGICSRQSRQVYNTALCSRGSP